MTRYELEDWLEENYPDDKFLIPDGFESCFEGVVHAFGPSVTAIFSIPKALAIFQKDGMSEDEAHEFFDFNIIGAWAGDGTPCWLQPSNLSS